MSGLLSSAQRRVPVFYSFCFDDDVMRVQQIRNIGSIEGNTPVSPNDWEKIKAKGDPAVEHWIDENMKYKQCVIVLIGRSTAQSKWVKYEIKKAWESRKGLFGIYVHNMRCPRTGTCAKGANPFANWNVGGRSMSQLITCYDPPATDAYNNIARNLRSWVTTAIAQAKAR